MEVYGIQGISHHSQGYIIINNYPVKTVKVFGRVLSLFYRDDANHYILNIDDCSGEKLNILVKVPEIIVFDSILEDMYVEVVGTISIHFDFPRQLVAVSFAVVGGKGDLGTEITCMSEILKVRQFLRVPWVYTPELRPSEDRNAPPVFHEADTRRRHEKLRLRLHTPDSQTALDVVSDTFSLDEEEIVVAGRTETVIVLD